jgi:hypothetical protein
MSAPEGDAIIATRVTRQLRERVQAAARAEDRSVSYVIRRALRQYAEAAERPPGQDAAAQARAMFKPLAPATSPSTSGARGGYSPSSVTAEATGHHVDGS